MGISKTEKFTAKQNQLANIAKALGHPARIAILEMLSKRNACVCGDLVDELPLSQSTISQHLAELKKVGLITGSINGPSICYCIDEKVWETSKLILNQFMTTSVHTDKCC
jgi:DNA-binding transcriptional ArsR family regulator